MLWLICFFNYADRQAIFSVFTVLQEEFGFTKSELGLIGSAFSWVYAFSAPLAGPVADRFPRKLVIIAGLYAWSLVTGLTALCSRLWHFVAVRAAEGLGETFYFPASMSLVSDYHDRRTRSRAMGFHQTSVYIGTIGGGTLAGLMAELWGWRSSFVLLGGLGVLLGLLLAAFIREPERDAAERALAAGAGPEAGAGTAPDAAPERVPIGRFLAGWARTPTAVCLALAFFGANSVALVSLVWLPTYLRESFGMSLAMAAFIATFCLQVPSVLGALCGGAAADGLRRRLPGGRILVQAAGALAGAPCIVLCGTAREVAAVVLAMAAFGFAKGIYDANIWAGLYDVIPPARRGAAVGLMNMIGWIGGALAAWGVGHAVDAGATLGQAIAATAGLYLGVAALLTVAGLVFAPGDVGRGSSPPAPPPPRS